MSVWFERSNKIEVDIERVKLSLENLGEHYAGLVRLMPGMKSVELVDQGSDFVTIRTNEGLMKRTNITKQFEADTVIVEFDEEYKAGRMVTATSHYLDEFLTGDNGIVHRTVISDMSAPGILGFFFRKFGKSSTGKAVLNSYKKYLEHK